LENPVFAGLFERAALSVGGSILAAQHVVAGGIAFHAPGGTHHGMHNRASGCCFFNDPVFAILTLLDQGKRVLYVDLDAHHGDGVETAFATDARVRTISVHEQDRWPFTGQLQDDAGGTAFNVPVPARMNDSEFSVIINGAVLPLARAFAPDAVVITMGADALAGDPLSSLALSNVALWQAVESVVACAPSAVVLGGGGYNPWTLTRAWAGMWGRLSGQTIPNHLPDVAQACLRGLTCDLVDEDEMQPEWLLTLADAPRLGPVRPRIHDLVAAMRQRETETA
jgi:acetoin utilization protein AcuC